MRNSLQKGQKEKICRDFLHIFFCYAYGFLLIDVFVLNIDSAIVVSPTTAVIFVLYRHCVQFFGFAFIVIVPVSEVQF